MCCLICGRPTKRSRARTRRDVGPNEQTHTVDVPVPVCVRVCADNLRGHASLELPSQCGQWTAASLNTQAGNLHNCLTSCRPWRILNISACWTTPPQRPYPLPLPVATPARNPKIIKVKIAVDTRTKATRQRRQQRQQAKATAQMRNEQLIKSRAEQRRVKAQRAERTSDCDD